MSIEINERALNVLRYYQEKYLNESSTGFTGSDITDEFALIISIMTGEEINEDDYPEGFSAEYPSYLDEYLDERDPECWAYYEANRYKSAAHEKEFHEDYIKHNWITGKDWSGDPRECGPYYHKYFDDLFRIYYGFYGEYMEEISDIITKYMRARPWEFSRCGDNPTLGAISVQQARDLLKYIKTTTDKWDAVVTTHDDDEVDTTHDDEVDDTEVDTTEVD